MVTKKTLARYIKEVLTSFYDAPYLEKHPLGRLLTQASSPEDRVQLLRQLLVEAVEKLRPSPRIPPDRPEWLSYRILSSRYLECLYPPEICQQLSIGRTTFYKYHKKGLETLTELLWPRLQGKAVSPSTSKVENMAAEEAASLVRGLHQQPVDLYALLLKIQNLALPLAQQEDIRLRVNISRPLPSILGDPAVLRQIILNVLIEAIRKTKGGSVSLEVKAVHGETRWTIKGGNFTEALLQSKGIAIGQYLLEACGGRLWLEEEKQTLHFSIPIHTKTILIIDDNPQTLELYERYLKGQGYQLHFAANAREAWKLLEKALPDLIILDVLMPSEDGWDTLQRLKTFPETKQIPILVCSVLDQPRLALMLGAAQVLQKPFDRHDLLQAISTLLTPNNVASAELPE
ncbi:MAG: response regulator [Anaerolineae bacterium]|nr:response regulator [Anaerolineae bacterium]